MRIGKSDEERAAENAAAEAAQQARQREAERQAWLASPVGRHAGYFFMPTGERTADRFLGTGQNVAVSGVTVGAYLFRRDPSRDGPGNESSRA